MKGIICQNALLVLLSIISSLIVIIESKKFCEQYNKNDNEIDFAFRYYIRNSINKLTKEYRKYFFIGNTYWKLTYIDGKDKTVIIDDESAGQSNWLSGDKYSMAWSLRFNDINKIGALRKDMETIDWLEPVDDSLNLTTSAQLTSSILIFRNFFKPIFAWIPVPLNNNDLWLTFWDNKAITQSYDMTYPYRPFSFIVTHAENVAIINGTLEKQVDKRTNLMAIMAQYSHYDYDNYPKQGLSRGQGSIVFMYVDTAIKYCYVGQPFNETACKPDNLKTLIDCLPTIPTNNLLITIILIVIVFVLFIITIVFVSYLCCSKTGRRHRHRDSEKSSKRSRQRSANNKN
ncbi:uncharacterized protein LOC128962795 [Oppia nitens]|uniref:uncharacterized protein LOC128962795 n=1 Tax=Oppia nitens TaxID=1686743 RepID=UPI0023DC1453|nr:uncharacterized protein LOC128962795 [Oppia nitens]